MDRSRMYRGAMPHYRINQTIYFVTWRLNKAQRQLDPIERSIVEAALKVFQNSRYILYAYVIMNDHVHVLVRNFLYITYILIWHWHERQ